MLAVHRSIQDIDASEWDRLSGDNAFATHGWLLTLERSWRSALQPLYFTLRGDHALIASAVCYIGHPTDEGETLDDLVFGRVRPVAQRLGFSFLPAIVCGPVLGYGWHIGIDPGLNTIEARAAQLAVLDAMEAESRARNLPLSFVHLLDEERGVMELLESRGYLRSRNVPVGVLDLEWRSFDDYLTSLPTKRRSEFRRQMNRNREAGNAIGLMNGQPGGSEHRMLELLDRNAQKHGARRFPCGQEFFAALRTNLGQQALIFTAHKAGTLTGVCVVLTRNATAFPVAIGVDAGLAGDDYTYFQLCYNSPIARSLEHGMNRMYYGRGMYEVKVRRGCRLTNSWIYMKSPGRTRVGSAEWFALASLWNRYKLAPEIRQAFMTHPLDGAP